MTLLGKGSFDTTFSAEDSPSSQAHSLVRTRDYAEGQEAPTVHPVRRAVSPGALTLGTRPQTQRRVMTSNSWMVSMKRSTTQGRLLSSAEPRPASADWDVLTEDLLCLWSCRESEPLIAGPGDSQLASALCKVTAQAGLQAAVQSGSRSVCWALRDVPTLSREARVGPAACSVTRTSLTPVLTGLRTTGPRATSLLESLVPGRTSGEGPLLPVSSKPQEAGAVQLRCALRTSWTRPFAQYRGVSAQARPGARESRRNLACNSRTLPPPGLHGTASLCCSGRS
ncbi:hypothetical protein CB1_000149012 [Camelus ferus]|nr:hypothetical protein CB1_000149012 [Camelus ferus]